MSNDVIHLRQQKRSDFVGVLPVLPRAPWWKEYTAATNAAALADSRSMVLNALAWHRSNPESADRFYLRDEVAGEVDACALNTNLPLEWIMDALSAAAELTPADMASPHDGITPWRERILYEAGLHRSSAFWNRMRTGERHSRQRSLH